MALVATNTTSALVQQCQKASNDVSTRHAVGLYCVPGHAGVRGMKSSTSLQETVLFIRLLDLSRILESRQNKRGKISCWLVKQHWARWRDVGNIQRQARELILGLCRDARNRFLSVL
jgi:hypothetical protein